MTLRRATSEDRDLVFSWRNRPEIVALGSSQRTVTQEEHRAWFARTLAKETGRLYIVHDEAGAPIGQVRLDEHADREAVVSIYLLSEHAGRGKGTAALEQAVERVARELGTQRVWAQIREDNVISRKSFARAGFRLTEEVSSLARPDHVVYVWEAP